ncbi:hypothetical protein N7494_007359 [Penicillium frequentans]|uniref:Uncharacterized protein n=1 Tax=Penicillium frequentans TaxID=3151616 RepID=A0AAD6GDF3_9EURO|nr:hypothetical protein N7494_007359 [Penicillium glabrum]
MVQPSIVNLPPQLRLYPTCGVKKEQPKPLFWFPGLNPPLRRRLSPIPGSKRTGFESLRRYPNDRKQPVVCKCSFSSPSYPSPHGAPVMAGILKATNAPRTSALDHRVHFGEAKVVEVERWMPQKPRSIMKVSVAPRTSAHDRRVHFGEEEVVVVERWMQQRARKPMYHPCPPPACALFPPIQKRVYQSWCFDPAAPTPDELDLQHRSQKYHRVLDPTLLRQESVSYGALFAIDIIDPHGRPAWSTGKRLLKRTRIDLHGKPAWSTGKRLLKCTWCIRHHRPTWQTGMVNRKAPLETHSVHPTFVASQQESFPDLFFMALANAVGWWNAG